MGERHSRAKKNRGESKLLVIILVLVIVVGGGLLAYKIWNDKQSTETQNLNTDQAEVVEIRKEPDPVTFAGTDRPIAVMIDNHKDALPQANINKASIVYEIIVEGGETRLMAVYKGVDLDKIGPIRSARHYYIDYAAENDAILVHFGESPQAAGDFKDLKVDEVNGLVESSSDFWRDSGKYAPHNAVSNTKSILKIAGRKNYRLVSDKSPLLNYVAKDFDLAGELLATDVTIPISNVQTVNYKYNENTKLYTRYTKGKAQTDWATKEEIVTKNIIVMFIDNYTLNDSENKGRQGLHNLGTKDGYYITNGKAEKITCTKPSRTEKTVYKTMDGEELKVNDGNTFIQIVPLNTIIDFGPQPVAEVPVGTEWLKMPNKERVELNKQRNMYSQGGGMEFIPEDRPGGKVRPPTLAKNLNQVLYR